jgi:ATP-dependent protease ClpP protease subunit
MRYTEIFGRTQITMAGQVDEGMIQMLDRILNSTYANPEVENRATLLLTTYGGASGYAMAMYERLRLAQRVFDLTVIGLGIVYSHGVTLMMALPREKRFVTAGTRLYLHELQKEMKLPLNGPQSARRLVLEQELRTLEEEAATLDWTVKTLAVGTGLPEKKLRTLMSGGTYLSGQEAVDLGFAGALIDEA